MQRLICVEEHFGSPVLAKAVGSVSVATAPYLSELGSEHQDNPARVGDRPGLLGQIQATELLEAPIEDRLRAMDDNNVDVQVLSYVLPLHLAPNAEGLIRGANEQIAAIVRAHPQRFAGFAALPWSDPAAAVHELDRSVGEGGLSGVLLPGRPGDDAFLDDARFSPVLKRLGELSVPLFIHPGPPRLPVQRSYYAGFNPELSARLSLFAWGWHSEAGIQTIRLILSGALDRFRGLSLISGHWGEMVPFFLQRLDDTLPQAVTGLSRTLIQTYRDQVYVTPSGMLQLPHFTFCCEVLGIDRILFSIDYPFLTMTGAHAWVAALPVEEDRRVAVASGNAERLLGLGGVT